MSAVTAEEFLGLQAPPPRKVPVPELGVDACLWVRSLTAAERDTFETSQRESIFGSKSVPDFRSRFVALVACDEHGRRIFKDEDAARIMQLPVAPVDRVYEAGCRLNRLLPEDLTQVFQGSKAPAAQANGSAAG
jgi:hypothetical protein